MGTGEPGNYYTSGGSDVVHHPALIHSIDGVTMWGTYKGVRVGVIKTNGRVATVFPDEDQGSVLKGRSRK